MRCSTLQRPDQVVPSGLRDLRSSILYSCGLRVSELVGLDIKSIYFDQRLVRVFGKGNKKDVPVGKRRSKPASLPGIHSPSQEKAEDMPGQALFSSMRGERLSLECRQHREKIRKEGGSCSTSVLMRCATLCNPLLDGGADLRSCRAPGTRESLNDSEVHHVSLDKLMEVYDKAHPRSK